MYKLISSVVFALWIVSVATENTCPSGDVMKEFKPDTDEMSKWAKDTCDARNNALTDEDLAKAKKCYTENLKPMFTSANGKAIDGFVEEEVFGDAKKEDMKRSCNDKKVQDAMKKAAMQKIGMKKGMEAKKEMEAQCLKFKAAFQEFNKCVKAP